MPRVITPAQLRCLQTLWAAKMKAAGISSAEDSREMRHQYVAAATNGRAVGSKELTFTDAKRVISLLAADRLRLPNRETALAAGTHGRRGYEGCAQPMMAGPQQFAFLEALRTSLGWTKERLGAFTERQLQGRQVASMADVNVVAYGLKAMLRRRAGGRIHGDAVSQVLDQPLPAPGGCGAHPLPEVPGDRGQGDEGDLPPAA